MVRDAEEFKADDEKVKQRVEAKNKLENYCYNIKSTVLGEEKMKTALGTNVETVQNTVDNAIKWLDENSDASTETFESKQTELENILNPLVQKAYQFNAPTSNSTSYSTDTETKQNNHDDMD
jgi:L1 cell adhesion molecule like protein